MRGTGGTDGVEAYGTETDSSRKMRVFFRARVYGAATDNNRTGPSSPDGSRGESAL